jgi:predicted nucleotidyltransferase
MEIEFKEDKIIFDRELSLLDRFVLSFVEHLQTNNINYVIISGYVAILFGRSRMSEDVDIFIENISFEKSSSHANSEKRKFYSEH